MSALLPKSWLIVPSADDSFAASDAVIIDLRGGIDHADARLVPAPENVQAAYLPPVGSTDTAALLDICVARRITTVFLSGPRDGADVQHLDILLQVCEARAGVTSGSTRIVAMAGDNPHGLLAAASFAGKSRRLIGLGWDAGALAAAMGLKSGLGADVAVTARATLLLAAAAAQVAAIDTIETDRNAESFRDACLHAKAQGFSAKMTSTLSQVPVIQSVFNA